MLRYLSYQTACDVVFVWWMLSWLITRHVLFCKVIASAYWDVPNQLEFGWWPERGYWLTKEVHKIFVSLLVVLEVTAQSSALHGMAQANSFFVLDNPEYLVILDLWGSISRPKG
jgi:TLC domain